MLQSRLAATQTLQMRTDCACNRMRLGAQFADHNFIIRANQMHPLDAESASALHRNRRCPIRDALVAHKAERWTSLWLDCNFWKPMTRSLVTGFFFFAALPPWSRCACLRFGGRSRKTLGVDHTGSGDA